MSGELEAAGAMATAGLVAGAIEGGESKTETKGACLNCGAQVEGRYCANCGQATHGNRKLFHFAEEFMHSIFHLDTKLWRTLPMVVLRPGTLTRNYVFGKRARYISPLALFLFSIFVLFFAVSTIEAPVEMQGSPQQQRTASAERLQEAREELAVAERELAEARVAPAPTDGTPPELGVQMAELGVRLAREEIARREATLARIDQRIAEQSGAAAPAPAEAPSAPAPAAEGEASAPAESVEVAAAPNAEEEHSGVGWRDGETWQEGIRRSAQREDFVVFSGFPALSERARLQLQNPDLALFRIQEAGSKFSFLLAPLSLPFIMLLFLWKRGTTMYDHIVYALYALSFASLLSVLVIAASKAPWLNAVTPWLVAALPIHTYFHLKGAYALGWWSALWRTVLMLIFATIIFTVFIVVIVIVGLAF